MSGWWKENKRESTRGQVGEGRRGSEKDGEETITSSQITGSLSAKTS